MKIKRNIAINVVDNVNHLLDITMIVLFAIVLLFAGYIVWDSYSVEVEALLVTNEFKVKQEEILNGEKVVGSITIDGTHIDYPLMQGSDNDWYLKHDYKDDYSIAGSIFLDYRNSLDDNYLVIYGHRMSGGAMFSDIGEYIDEGFYLAHKSARLRLREILYEVKLLGYAEISERDEVFYSIGNYSNDEIMDRFSALRRYGAEYDGGRLVLLSTCDARRYSIRSVVLGEILE